MKKLRQLLGKHWRLIISVVVCGLGIGFLLLFRLGSLTNGLGSGEISQQAFAIAKKHIGDNPLNAPLTVVEFFFLHIFGRNSSAILRLPSAIFGLGALVSFAYVLRRWYGIRSAIFGSILLACSAWFLHVSRYAGPEVLYLWAVPTLLATHIAWERHGKRPLVSFLAIAMLAVLLYIPGMVWLIIISLVLQPHHLIEGWRGLKKLWQQLSLPLLFIILLVPLGWAIAKTPSLGQTWLGLPHTFTDPGEVPRRLAQCVGFLIWRGPNQPQLWLDRIAILDIFTSAMALLGAFFYAKHIAAPRTRLLAGLLLVGAIFYSLGGPVGFSVLIPIIYIFIAGGVGYLLHEWLRVFPRNPLARNTGYVLISLAIFLSCTYNVRAYFVAWPHDPTTVATFRNQH